MKTKTTLFILLNILFITSHAQPSNTWLGSTNNDWNTASNWSENSVPTSEESIVVNNAVNYLALDANRTVASISIGAGGIINLGSYQLNVTGNWSNSGLLVAGTSNVVFSGIEGIQEISGNQTFNDLTIQNSNGAKIVSGSDSLTGVLSIVLGNFYTNNTFVLISDPTYSASIGEIIDGSIIGDITVQRYIEVNFSDWRFLSSPIKNTTLNSVNDDFWTAGFTGSTYPSSSFVSIYYYDESVPGTADYGYVGATNINDIIPEGKGFMAYMGTASLGSIVDFTGEPNTGPINLPVSYTAYDTISDGWNLVGNPYPSAIDWDDNGITKTNINNAIYIWNPTLGLYTSYVDGLGTNGGTNIIASSQSFYVKANANSPVLQLTESCKTSTNVDFIKQSETFSAVTIHVEGSTGSDEVIINTNSNATSSFDESMDALKFLSNIPGIPMIYTSRVGQSDIYAIDQFPAEEMTIPLTIQAGSSEIHTISFSGIENFTDASCIYLEDLFTGDLYNLENTSSISLYLSDTTTIARFLIKIGAPNYVQEYHATCFNANDGFIDFGRNSNTTFDITWSDAMGNTILNETEVFQISSLSNLGEGLYFIETTSQLCGVHTDSVYINQPPEITAQFEASSNTIYLPQNSDEIHFTNLSSNASYYSWEFDNLGSSNEFQPTFNFNTPGIYTVSLSAYQNSTCYAVEEHTIEVVSTLVDDTFTQNPIEIQISNDELIIFSENANQIEIRNLAGQIIYSGSGMKNQTNISLYGVAHQVLIVSVINDYSIQTKKIMY